MPPSFNAHTKEEALSQYAKLSSSPNPNDKLLALGGLIQFIQGADPAFLVRCARATDYDFLHEMIRNGITVTVKDLSDGADLKLHEELQNDRGQLSHLACAVIGVFSELEEMKADPGILNCIPALISALDNQYSSTNSGGANNRTGDEMKDTLDTIQSLAKPQKGADLTLSRNSSSILIRFILTESECYVDVMKVLVQALKNCSPSVDPVPVLKPLVEMYSTTRQRSVILGLTEFFTDVFTSSPPPKPLHVPLYRGIMNLTTSKIDEHTTSLTIIFHALLLAQIGPNFLFDPPLSEPNGKQRAILTIGLASSGIQVGFVRLPPGTVAQQRLIAELEIMHVTTTWLLTSEEDTPKIGNEILRPDEVLHIQRSLSTAARETSLYLRQRYDMKRLQETSADDTDDPIVRVALRFLGGWLGDGGSGDVEESLGLLEVLMGLCLSGDVEITTWAIRAIKGIVLYTEDRETELLTSKDELMKLLGTVIEKLSSSDVSGGTMVMIREICGLFRILVDSQPLILTERAITSFPTNLYDCFTMDRVGELTWDARTEAALLGLEILLKMAEERDSLDRQFRELLLKWVVKIKQLIRLQTRPDVKEDLELLACALENLSI